MGWREALKERGLIGVLFGDECAERVGTKVAEALENETKKMREARLKREAEAK